MGFVRADIEIANSGDMTLARRGYIEKDKIRRKEINLLIDTGAYNLSINENLAAQVGLAIIDKQSFELADGEIKVFDIAEPVELRFKNRMTTCNPIILPGETEMLLGSIPLEDMDVIIDSRRETLDLPPDRPYLAKKKLK